MGGFVQKVPKAGPRTDLYDPQALKDPGSLVTCQLMWKWLTLWLGILAVFVFLVIRMGVTPKPISKIRISAFDSEKEAAAAVVKRLFLELRDSRIVVLSAFQDQSWMKPFVETFAIEANRYRPFSIFYGPHAIPGFIPLPETLNEDFFRIGGRKLIYDPQATQWIHNKVDALKIFLINLNDVALPEDVSCQNLKKEELFQCLAKDFLWRMKKKPHQAPLHRYVMQVEQVGLGDFLVFMRLPLEGGS